MTGEMYVPDAGCQDAEDRIAEQDAEIARLREQHELLNRACAALEVDVQQAHAERDALAGCLYAYGQHRPQCPSDKRTDGECDCGLRDALTRMGEKEGA